MIFFISTTISRTLVLKNLINKFLSLVDQWFCCTTVDTTHTHTHNEPNKRRDCHGFLKTIRILYINFVSHFATFLLFQIGCTGWASFFLADGKMFGCGLNSDSSLGVGHDKEVKIPTLLRTDGHM